MKSTKFFAALVAAALCVSVQTAQAQMFENAIRSSGRAGEGAGIVKLAIPSANGGFFNCTAFFVKNRYNKPYLMTARHCSMFQLAKSCKAGVVSLTTQEGSFVGTCRKMLIENRELDETLIEAEFQNWETAVLPRIAFYNLSGQHPQLGTRLEVLGYPADPERKGAFTVTRNCWVSAGRMVTVTDYPRASGLEDKFRAAWAPTKVKIDHGSSIMTVQQSSGPSPLSYLIDRFAAYHNCSVYGGNSGGPIAIENTRTVLGLPTSFFPDSKTIQPETLTTTMDATADFVARNYRKLGSLGVEIVQPYAYGN